MCIACVEHWSVAVLVDHIVPVNGPNDPLFFLRWNWEPLCREHHDTKAGHDDRIRAMRTQLRTRMPEQGTQTESQTRNWLLAEIDLWKQWLDLDSMETITQCETKP